MSSAENDNSAPEQADSTELSPLEGGRWRPVRPEELLRKNGREEKAELEPSVGSTVRTACPRFAWNVAKNWNTISSRAPRI